MPGTSRVTVDAHTESLDYGIQNSSGLLRAADVTKRTEAIYVVRFWDISGAAALADVESSEEGFSIPSQSQSLGPLYQEGGPEGLTRLRYTTRL